MIGKLADQSRQFGHLSKRDSVLFRLKVKWDSLPSVSRSCKMVGNDFLGLDIINMISSAKAETLNSLLPNDESLEI